MTPRLTLLAALALGLAASPAWAGVKDGVDAWSRGDYARAVAEWQKPAAAGDADAQFNLAQAYKLGKGVPADMKRAETLYLQAAQQGHLQAADNYGLVLFQSGRREAALKWLEGSADRGEPRAQYLLGIAAFNGDMVPQDRVRGYALMTRAAASGLETAKTALASMNTMLPLGMRQQGVAMAADLEAKANAARSVQVASLGLGGTSPAVPSAVSAGADYARPMTEAPKSVSSAPKAAMLAPARVAEALPVQPAPAKAAAPAVAASGAWRVQLGAFAVPGSAQALWGKLKGNAAFAGRQGFFVPAGKLTRLQAGPFASHAEARTACAGLGGGQACVPVGG